MNAFSGSGPGGRSKSLVLTAMIFAVAMTFIDQTIVPIAAPTIQHDLGLSSSGMQWAINAYLLALAALFAFGGRLADTAWWLSRRTSRSPPGGGPTPTTRPPGRTRGRPFAPVTSQPRRAHLP